MMSDDDDDFEDDEEQPKQKMPSKKNATSKGRRKIKIQYMSVPLFGQDYQATDYGLQRRKEQASRVLHKAQGWPHEKGSSLSAKA